MTGAVRVSCILAILATGVSSLGCFRVPQQSATLASVKDVAVSSTLLQLRAYETGRLVSSIVEAAADSIGAASKDPAIRARALRWKMAAIPLVQEASLHDEPLVAVVDLWALALQQANYFERGDGRLAFGPSQNIAVAAARQIVVETRRTFSRTLRSGEIPAEAVDAVPAWAAEHPITGTQMHRVSLLSSDWQALGIEESSLSGSVASLNRTLLGVTQRMGYLNESMLKQAGWHAELTASALLRSPRTDSLYTTFQVTSAALGAALQSAPAEVETVRAMVFRDLKEQRLAVFTELNRQRVATLAAIADERVAAFTALRVERTATLAAMDSVAGRAVDRLSMVATTLANTFVMAVGVLVVALSLGVVVLARAR